MKKLIAIASALLVVGTCQAATLNWSMSNILDPVTKEKASGFAAYLFITQQSSDFGAKTTTVADIESLIKSKGDLSDYIAGTGSSNNSGMLNGATGYYGNFGAGDSLTGFAVIFDAADAASAKHYIVTAEKSASWTSSTGMKTLGFGSQANATWTAVPEPSTAVLALAGLALLLKRRKA